MATWDDYIDKHAKRVNIDPAWMRKIIRIESGGNANARTGSYHGLFQLSEREFRNHGGTGSIYDPEQNTAAAANKIAQESLRFEQKYKRKPTLNDVYMMHQQGEAGYAAHMANPDRPAWMNMRSTGEGQQKGDRWAKAAIWGNLTPADKAKFGSVENVTSLDFMNAWSTRVDGTATASVSRGRAGITWHRSRGDPETVATTQAKDIAPPRKVPEFEPIPVPHISVTAPEAPDVQLRRVQSP